MNRLNPLTEVGKLFAMAVTWCGCGFVWLEGESTWGSCVHLRAGCSYLSLSDQ